MRLTPRPRAITVAAALALLAAAAPAAAQQGTTFPDPVGDAPAATDMGNVDVYNDGVGLLTATINFPVGQSGNATDGVVVDFGTIVNGACDFSNLVQIGSRTDGSSPTQAVPAGVVAQATAKRQGNQLVLAITDPSLYGTTSNNCARAATSSSGTLLDETGEILFGAPAATPAPPVAPATPATPATPPTLASLPGSLLSPTRCQKLGGTGFVRTREVPGVGKVRIQMRSNATSKPGTPLKLRIRGGNPSAVNWTLDGQAVSGRARGLTLRPSRLASRTDHVVTVAFTSRSGQSSSYDLAFKTLGCDSALTASTSKRRRGSVLRLRIDSTEALSTATFAVPRSIKGATTSFKVRLRSASTDRTQSWTYAVRNGRVFTPEGAPNFTGTSTGIRLNRLPAQTGILRVDFTTTAKPLNNTSLRASAVIGGATKRLKASTD